MLAPELSQADAREAPDELDRFLEPISAQEPCGVDLFLNRTASSRYTTTLVLRKTALDKEKESSGDTSAVAAGNAQWDGYNRRALTEWRQVASDAEKMLIQESKDLRVASWYAEAQVRIEGFSGLALSIRLIRRLIEKYWPSLYPQPDESERNEHDKEGYEAILNPLKIFDYDERGTGALRMSILTLPLSQGISPAYYYPLILAPKPGAQGLRRKDAMDASQIRAQWADQSRTTSPEFFATLRIQIDACTSELKALAALLEQKWPGGHRPSLRIRELLENCRDEVRKMSGEQNAVEAKAEPELDGAEKSAEKTSPSEHFSEFASRQHALATIHEAANYFLRREPHSPVAYLLLRAESWGNMSLLQLLENIVVQGETRTKFMELTGVMEVAVPTVEPEEAEVSEKDPPATEATPETEPPAVAADSSASSDRTIDVAEGTDPSQAETAKQAEPTANATPPARKPETVRIESREAALSSIQRAANYFRHIEPHSPVPYQLDRAVRWGRMALKDLLAELIPDVEAQKNYRDRTGMPNDQTVKS